MSTPNIPPCKCQQAGCTEKIKYEPQRLLGLMTIDSMTKKKGYKTVYLTCAQGHTYPYTVQD